jgi:hypothetical protein
VLPISTKATVSNLSPHTYLGICSTEKKKYLLYSLDFYVDFPGFVWFDNLTLIRDYVLGKIEPNLLPSKNTLIF